MLSPDAISALAIAASGVLSAMATKALERRSARLKAEQAERETEKRAGWVKFVGDDRVREIVRNEVADIVASTIVTNLRGLCGAVDKRMAAFEVALKSALSLDASDREDARADRAGLRERERERLDESITIRKTLQALNDATRQLLALFDPSKAK